MTFCFIYDIFLLVIFMTIKNKFRFTIFVFLILLITFFLIWFFLRLILKKDLPLNLSNAKPAIICEDDVKLYYDKDEFLVLSKYDLISIVHDNFLSNTYTISFAGRSGEIPKSCAKYYQFHTFEKHSLMVDVSEFNMRDNFENSGDFALFVLNHGINYVYIRLGGRGYGEKGNFYRDACADDYIAICDFLKIPYGFYFLDEALNEEEVIEEVDFVKSFLAEHPAKMNVLPLAIDLEFQEGEGRADGIWDERTDLLQSLIQKFNEDNIHCILYTNAKIGNDYLSELDCDFWVARYPQNGIIPNSTFAEFINFEQAMMVSNYVLDNHHQIKAQLDTGKEFINPYSGDFLDKIIGWQFSADGATEDGIHEAIDLSIVKNAYFKKYLP